MRRGLIALAMVFACSSSRRTDAPVSERDPADEHFELPPLAHAQVILHDAFGGAHAVDAEVAATPQARERGLMWRKQLPDGQGMLFIFPYDSVLSFWMRNTLIPLDMLFIDAGRKVLGSVENAVPQDRKPRGVRGLSRYVLEVPGGWVARNGIKPGNAIEIRGEGRLEVK